MTANDKTLRLGKLVAVYCIAPVYVQRAAFMAVLSFMFFLAMMFAFYVLQSALYFLLSTAFLIIYLLTMFSFVMQRKKNVQIFENGLLYRKNSVLWSEIAAVDGDGKISLKSGKRFEVSSTIHDFESLIAIIKRNAAV